MEKYGDVEKLEVLRGKEAEVLNEHMAKTGRFSVSDFNKTQKKDLIEDLEAVRRMEGEGGASQTDRTDDSDKQPSSQDS